MLFSLHPRLEADSVLLGFLPLSMLRLMNVRNFPWLLLVPQRANISELYELEEDDQQQWMREVVLVSNLMKQIYRPDKLNIATLGNQVPQLHMHVIARFSDDAAWPKPVWGAATSPYSVEGLEEAVLVLKARGEGVGIRD